MNESLPFLATIVFVQGIFLVALLLVLWRAEKFLRMSMVYMKSRDIHDVLAADSLLEDKPKTEEDAFEVVPGRDPDPTTRMREIQQKHRSHYPSVVTPAA